MIENYHDRVKRLKERTSVDGWKGPGSKIIDDILWLKSTNFVDDVINIISSKIYPFISCSDTDIHLNYGDIKYQLTIKIRNDFIISYEYHDPDYSEDENIISWNNALNKVVQFINEKINT